MEEFMEKNISVKQASKLMGKSEQFIRIGLQTNRLPFGSAVYLGSQWTYYISPIRFYHFIGIDIKEVKETKEENRKKEK